MKTIIRALTPADVGKYADLCAARDGLDRKAAEDRAELVAFLAFQNPTSDDRPTYFVAETGDRLTGHLGRMPTWFFADGRRQLATFAHDLFVHPDLQKSGHAFFVAMRFYEAIEKASDSFVGMIWTNDINVQLQNSRKYDRAYFQRMVHVLRADSQIQKIDLLGPMRQVLKPAARLLLKGIDAALSSLHQPRKVEHIEKFDKRFDQLADRIGPRMGIAPVKDAAYLDYKYTRRPFIDTECFAAVGAPGELLGFVVLRKLGPGEKVGTVLELVAARDDVHTILTLMHAAIGYYRQVNAQQIEAAASDPVFIALYERALFLKRGELPFSLANPQKYRFPDTVRTLKKWHLSYGDSEGPY